MPSTDRDSSRASDRRREPADASALLTEAQRLAPGWLVALIWPPVKLATVVADRKVIRSMDSTSGRLAYLALRGAEWALFLAFPKLAFRSSSAAYVTALTFAQGALTAEAFRRARPVHPMAARLFVPQLGWLLYASAVPLIVARRLRRKSTP